jgi:hypothetical protein
VKVESDSLLFPLVQKYRGSSITLTMCETERRAATDMSK